MDKPRTRDSTDVFPRRNRNGPSFWQEGFLVKQSKVPGSRFLDAHALAVGWHPSRQRRVIEMRERHGNLGPIAAHHREGATQPKVQVFAAQCVNAGGGTRHGG